MRTRIEIPERRQPRRPPWLIIAAVACVTVVSTMIFVANRGINQQIEDSAKSTPPVEKPPPPKEPSDDELHTKCTLFVRQHLLNPEAAEFSSFYKITRMGEKTDIWFVQGTAKVETRAATKMNEQWSVLIGWDKDHGDLKSLGVTLGDKVLYDPMGLLNKDK